MSFRFHTDPAHGWIEVDRSALDAAGLKPTDFSAYSYRRGDTFFLEEDCDASKFVAAWQEKTGEHATFESVPTNGESFIRSLPSIRQ